VHPKGWYLTIADKRDVIEIPFDGELDINGWDVRKSLKLLRKSNSPLLEWLSSRKFSINYWKIQKALDKPCAVCYAHNA
jgi:predicted nucleotidyltransferase